MEIPQLLQDSVSAILDFEAAVLCATLVGIGHSDVLPLRPQFITPQDGDQKQDCETKAAYRWFDQNAARYASLRPNLGDDLYANQLQFHLPRKEGSHKTSYLICADANSRMLSYSKLPIRDGNDALKVNYVELQIRRVGDRKPTQSFRFITSLDVTKANAVIAAGKIENEGFNLLKKHGYHMEHNKPLSQNFLHRQQFRQASCDVT